MGYFWVWKNNLLSQPVLKNRRSIFLLSGVVSDKVKELKEDIVIILAYQVIIVVDGFSLFFPYTILD